MDIALSEAGGYKWPYAKDTLYYFPGFYTGAAGIGDRFLDYYEATKDTVYRHFALGAAEWVPNSVYSFDYTGIDIISGASGQGLFMLRAYKASNKPSYLTFARKAGDWLLSQAIPEGRGFKWNISPYLQRVYTGFSHGVAGVGYFLAELYKQTKDTFYLHYAKGAAQWLMDVAVPVGIGCKWWYEDSKQDDFSTGWCHGPAGTCLLFLELYDVTHDALYLTHAEKGALWLINKAIGEAGGYKWEQWEGYPYYDVTICHGAAGVGEFFYELYKTTKNSVYLQVALGAANWLKNVAVQENGGYKWATYGSYCTGHSVGTAGISLFFLKLYSITTDISQQVNTKIPLKVFPNPASNSINVICSVDNPSPINITIINNIGTLVRNLKFDGLAEGNERNIQIDINEIPSGIYYLILRAGKNTETRVFAVIR